MTHAGPIIIDPFESGPFSFTSNVGQVAQTQTALPDVLGAKRRVAVDLSQPGLLSAALATTAADDAFQFVYQLSSPATAFNFAALDYGQFVGSMNANLRADGNDRFRLVFDDAPAGGIVRFQLNNFTGGGGTVAEGGLVLTGPGTYELPYSSFFPVFTPIFDFTSVDWIVLNLRVPVGSTSGQFVLSDFRAVPEPAASLPLIFGIAMLLQRLRRS